MQCLQDSIGIGCTLCALLVRRVDFLFFADPLDMLRRVLAVLVTGALSVFVLTFSMFSTLSIVSIGSIVSRLIVSESPCASTGKHMLGYCTGVPSCDAGGVEGAEARYSDGVESFEKRGI